MALLKIFSCLCCIIIVSVNIVAMIIGVLLTLIGCLFTWGFAVLSGTVSGTLSGMFSSVTSILKTNLNIDIDINGLIRNLSQITGSMGAAFLIIGISLIVIACLGCCGACCSKNICLLVYVVCVGVIVLAQGAIVAIWFANSDVLKQLAKLAMIDSLKKYTGMNSQNIQSLVQNLVHIFVGCCGVNNGTDFIDMNSNWNRKQSFNQSGYYFEYNLTYPLTCCKFNMTSYRPTDDYCSYNNTNTNTSWYQVGCYTKIFAQIDQYFSLSTIFFGLGGIIGLQVVLLLGAGIIMKNITKKKESVQPHPQWQMTPHV